MVRSLTIVNRKWREFMYKTIADLLREPAGDKLRMERCCKPASIRYGIYRGNSLGKSCGSARYSFAEPVGDRLGRVFLNDYMSNEEILNKLFARGLLDRDNEYKVMEDSFSDCLINVYFKSGKLKFVLRREEDLNNN